MPQRLGELPYARRHVDQGAILTASIALLLTSTGFVPPAFAQDLEPGASIMLEPIIITARRHSEDAQRVPISVNVLESRDVVRISPATSNSEIARSTPNFMLNEAGGPYSNIGTIRGVGSLFTITPDDTSVSFNVDEVPVSAFGLPPSTLDLSRVEVLRGPQGTLYGRNSQAGAVNFIPNRPEFAPETSIRGEVYFFANNLLDERYQITGGSYGPGSELVRPGVGRTIGLGAAFSF